MSDELKIIAVDVATGETIEKKLTKEDIAERKELAAYYENLKAEQEAKEAARASALAKLTKLGLTEKEIAAL